MNFIEEFNPDVLLNAFAEHDTLLLAVDYTIPFSLKHYYVIIDTASTANIVNIIFISYLSTLNENTNLEYVKRHIAIENYIKDKELFSLTVIRPSLTFKELNLWSKNAKDTKEIVFPIPIDAKLSLIQNRDLIQILIICASKPEEHEEQGRLIH